MLYSNEPDARFDSKSLDLALLALQELAERKSKKPLKYSRKDFNDFFNAIVAQDDQLQIELIEKLIYQGVSLEKIYENLIPETAEALGTLWKRDELSFVEVNIGAQRLHRLTRIYENRYLGPMYLSAEGPNILMILPKGEIHTLGLITASGIFKKNGADPYVVVGYSISAIKKLLDVKPFKIIGMSISNSENLDEAIKMAKSLKSSVHREIPIILGGNFIKNLDIKNPKLDIFDLISSDPEKVLNTYFPKTKD
tara:strand:- start:717 stop:1475 length:759 start_codon:yes stop_codon:yes gene_type:complete